MGNGRRRAAIRVGIAFRPEFAAWLKASRVDCLEASADDFYRGGLQRLRSLARAYPLILQGRGLSLGSQGPLEPRELARFAAMATVVKPLWVTAPLGFSRMPGTDLGFPSPFPLNEPSLDYIAGHAARLMEACGTRLLVANIVGYLRFPSSMPEPEFLNRLCGRAGCGLLLDLTRLSANGRNQGFDPQDWLSAIDHEHVVQIRVGGCREIEGRWDATHDCSPGADVLALASQVCAMAGVQAVVLERHAAFPPVADLARDLEQLRLAVKAAVR